MRTLAATLTAVALTAGLTLAGGGIAFADTNDNHSVSDDHSDNSHHASNGACSERHSVNILTCTGLDLGNVL
jgi:hypothetical protein